jgi:hypothetical protein
VRHEFSDKSCHTPFLPLHYGVCPKKRGLLDRPQSRRSTEVLPGKVTGGL